MPRKPFGPEGPPIPEALPRALELPEAEVTRERLAEERLAQRLEAPEVEKPPEKREDELRQMHILDNADLESLLAVIREVEVIRALERDAAETIERYAEITPKLRETLLTPQSPDKHAEGPLMEDHLRLMLMQVRAIGEGRVRLAELPEFRDKLAAMPDEAERQVVRDELERIEAAVCSQPKFFEIFTLYHDFAKPDTIGFTAAPGSTGEALGFVKFEKIERRPKRMSREDALAYEERERDHQMRLSKLYRELLAGFTRERPDLLREPAKFQEAFYEACGISLTHYGHGEVAVQGENREDLGRVMERAEFSTEERALMEKLIEIHIEGHVRFAQVDPKQYARQYGELMKKVEGLARPPREVLGLLRAAALLDVLGTKRIAPDGGRVSEVQYTLNFLAAERAYEVAQVEAAKREAVKRAKQAAGFTSEWLISLGLAVKSIGEAHRAMEAAIASGALTLPTELEPHRALFEEKLAGIREKI